MKRLYIFFAGPWWAIALLIVIFGIAVGQFVADVWWGLR